MAELRQVDLAVIGSGPAGYVAAIRGGQLGLKTAIIEAGELYGGTCLQWGCIPTKAFLFNAEVYGYFQNAREYGISCKHFSLDWDAIQERKNRIIKKLTQGVEFLLKKNKVEIVHGRGQLMGGGKIALTRPEAGTIMARNIILATGSEAKTLAGLEPDAKAILTNKEALGLKHVPASMVIIGAGAVGVEFASIFHRLGARVTLLEMLPRVLPGEDAEVSAEIEKSLRKQGIVIHTGVKVEKAGKEGKLVRVAFSAGKGPAQQVEAETLLMAVGRTPNTTDIGLEHIKIVSERGFIKVDGFMRTDEPGLYAVGDIVSGAPMLAHVGEMQGIVAATHAAGKAAEPLNYRQAPNCIYCEPEVASVGLTESQAREAGYKVRAGKFPFSANSKAAIMGAREGFVKIVCDEPYGEILGVHMVGPRATEMIAEAVVAMRLEATAEDLAHAIHPHPTLSETIMEAAHAAHDWPIHL